MTVNFSFKMSKISDVCWGYHILHRIFKLSSTLFFVYVKFTIHTNLQKCILVIEFFEILPGKFKILRRSFWIYLFINICMMCMYALLINYRQIIICRSKV